mgnify:FL=1
MNDQEPEVCGCGKHGCLEQYASATGIVRLANRKLAATDGESALRGLKKITAKDVFDEAKAGDRLAIEIVEEVGAILGNALASVCCVVDPEIIVIGGGVSKAGRILIDVIRKNFVVHAFNACQNTEFALATLGNDAGMYGCMNMIL